MAKYWRLRLKGDLSPEQVQSALPEGTISLLRVHKEAGETHVYFAAAEGQVYPKPGPVKARTSKKCRSTLSPGSHSATQRFGLPETLQCNEGRGGRDLLVGAPGRTGGLPQGFDLLLHARTNLRPEFALAGAHRLQTVSLAGRYNSLLKQHTFGGVDQCV